MADACNEWDGYEMAFGVIRKADLIEYLDQSRALLRDYEPPSQSMNAVCDALTARSLVADASTFLKALGVPQEE